MTQAGEVETARVKDALRRLAQSPKAPSTTARLRTVLPEIEAARAAGASLAEIRAALAGLGIALSEQAFKCALYRARKGRKQAAPGAERHDAAANAARAAPRVGNPADLRRLRQEPIDLEALEALRFEPRSV